MTDKIQISIDRDTYERLQTLMVPPLDDVDAVIKSLLCEKGQCDTGGASRAAKAVEASTRHYSMEQELERARQGVYESGGNT